MKQYHVVRRDPNSTPAAVVRHHSTHRALARALEEANAMSSCGSNAGWCVQRDDGSIVYFDDEVDFRDDGSVVDLGPGGGS